MRREAAVCMAVTLMWCCVASAADRGFGGQVCAPDSTMIGKQWLFVIGIGEYRDPRFPDLRCAVGDAKTVRDVCTERYVFNQVVELYNEQATRSSIIRKLRDLAQSISPDDSLFIYYAGHGYLDEVLNAGFWIPCDGKRGDDSTWISNVRIKQYLHQGTIKARHILLVSDSCFAGEFFSGARTIPRIADPYARRAYLKTSRQAITSGDLEPVADGPFARFFVRALRENQDPYLTPTRVFVRVTEGVELATVKQTPLMGYIGGTDSERGEFVFFLKPQLKLNGKLRVGTIKVLSSVAGIDVSVDGKSIGKTERGNMLTARNIAVGEHTVAYTHPDYSYSSEDVVVSEGGTLTIAIGDPKWSTETAETRAGQNDLSLRQEIGYGVLFAVFGGLFMAGLLYVMFWRCPAERTTFAIRGACVGVILGVCSYVMLLYTPVETGHGPTEPKTIFNVILGAIAGTAGAGITGRHWRERCVIAIVMVPGIPITFWLLGMWYANLP